MQRKTEFAVGEYYHLYNRGVDKREIFIDKGDYRRFLALLHMCNSNQGVEFGNYLQKGHRLDDVYNEDLSKDLVSIGAYCLMPNHFHLLVREKIENGISTFMKKILTGYSMYFNKKYERTGTLFEGRFKGKHVGDDRYLEYLFAYIHLNPVKLVDFNWRENNNFDKQNVKRAVGDYQFSSYGYYIGASRQENKILDNQNFPEYFKNKKEFSDFVDIWLNFSEIEKEEYLLNQP